MDCPTCGRSLATEQGMRQHHTKVHGDPLPNRTCKGCGTEFYDSKSRRVFCDDCNPNAGPNNGNWKDAKETASCDRCGGEFTYYPSNKDGVYCPECVESAEEFLGTPYADVVDAPVTTRVCEECDESFTLLVSSLKHQPGRFCSWECFREWMFDGESRDSVYTGKWWSAREAALERDGYQCRNCGATEDEIGREPDVHHLVPVREFEDPQDAHQVGNLISLCRSCHRKAEYGSIQVPSPDGT